MSENDNSARPDAEVWRRRERALFVGILLWASLVGFVATVWADALGSWLLTTSPFVVAGSVLVSIGLLGGFAHSVLLALRRWWMPDNSHLTEVDWDES